MKNNVRAGALIPAIIGTVIAIFGIGPYDYIFAYFPEALFGSLVGLLLYAVIYHFSASETEKQNIEKMVDYDKFDMESE